MEYSSENIYPFKKKSENIYDNDFVHVGLIICQAAQCHYVKNDNSIYLIAGRSK